MTRYMYDSVTPGTIPGSATMVAGYADGLYANLTEMAARFPHAVRVSIAVRWTTRAQVLDVETGDATPAEAVTWCTKTMSDKANRDLTVYCNTSTWPAVRAAFRAAGVTEPNYWVAQYDNNPTIPAGAIAKQYIGGTNGYDKSIVADYWPGIDTAPTPPENNMPLSAADAQTVWGYSHGDHPDVHQTLATAAAQATAAAAGVKALVAQVGAANAAIAALAKALAASGGITAEQVQAAAQAGAKAALAELGQELGKAGA